MWTRHNSIPDNEKQHSLISEESGKDLLEGASFDGRSIEECDIDTVREMYHYTNGTVLELNGHIEDAIREYRETIKINPREGFYHYNLGVALLKNDEYNEAFKSLTEALSIDPEDFEARCALADVHMALGNNLLIGGMYEDAAAEFESAISIDPEYAEYHYCLGCALIRAIGSELSGMIPVEYVSIESSIKELRTTLKLDPEHTEARKCLGKALTLSRSEQDRKEGLGILTELLASDPLNEDLRQLLASYMSGSIVA